jgi:CheY-like chemotaxis protein
MPIKEQLLIIDENTIMLRFLTNLLSEKYSVICKVNAIDAFRWLEEGNYPAAIISDISSPGMKNLSFLDNLKVSGFYRDTPVILISELLQPERDNSDNISKADAWFTKPFDPISLKNTIGNLLTRQQHATA